MTKKKIDSSNLTNLNTIHNNNKKDTDLRIFVVVCGNNLRYDRKIAIQSNRFLL